ncbi:cyclic-di-AMP receptor [Alkalihalobacillus sp. MEB130]|uniref:cyclic-di-AMP receptor n=1 Tax=Alkalihalobacillus sp. MEB130 TaxID=2976704 RepID=UPI0028DDA0BC|nr:cyclic-di-AMP receptor [Alkalihalobacillus sp. MEB130]MDT8863083.1 cyclic-di-AMP receptor [Alkalihalobacillus sp. MEB130]
MKLLVCIIDNVYADEVEVQLKKQGYRMTELASSGGFWKKGNTTFLFGVEEGDLENLQQALKDVCVNYEKRKQRKSKQAHRYTSFIIDVKDAAPFLTMVK